MSQACEIIVQNGLFPLTLGVGTKFVVTFVLDELETSIKSFYDQRTIPHRSATVPELKY